MPLHDLIFSEKMAKRLQRHLLFWGIWWIYFSLCDYLYQLPLPGKMRPFYLNVGSHLVFKIFLLLVVYAIACYIIINVVLPVMTKRKWLKAILILFTIAGYLYLSAYFLFWYVFPMIDVVMGSSLPQRKTARFWPAVNLGLMAPLKIFALAIIIKYVKGLWLKQKESERLQRQKINTELQLLKAQIHPGILFKTLDNIYDYSKVASPRAPELLVRLSDQLSYMLYECEQDFVPLEKEIEMMKGYIAMEKLSRKDEIDIEVNIMDDLKDKLIAPFLLHPFIENSFNLSKDNEHAWINIDISIHENFLNMKLANGIANEQAYQEADVDNGLIAVQKRLTLLYPQKHELKIAAEQEMLIVHLKIKLTDSSISISDKYENRVVDYFE